MLTLVIQGNTVELKPDTMIIVEHADESLYDQLANEDVKLDFDGERLFIHSPANYQHEWINFEVLQIFKQYFQEQGEQWKATGPHFSVQLPSGRKTEPDVVVIPAGSVNITDSVFTGVPPLVVEILSPSTRRHDLEEKLPWYQENSLPEIWYIDPENKVIIAYSLELSGEYSERVISGATIKSRNFIDLEIEVVRVFQENI